MGEILSLVSGYHAPSASVLLALAPLRWLFCFGAITQTKPIRLYTITVRAEIKSPTQRRQEKPRKTHWVTILAFEVVFFAGFLYPFAPLRWILTAFVWVVNTFCFQILTPCLKESSGYRPEKKAVPSFREAHLSKHASRNPSKRAYDQSIMRPMRLQRGMNFSLFQDQYLMNARPLITERSTKPQKRLS
jgi:hypothetical protein